MLRDYTCEYLHVHECRRLKGIMYNYSICIYL